MTRTSTGALAALGSMLLAGSASPPTSTFERLRNPEPQNWLMNHGDYGAHHYSSLERINKTNVKNLRFAFSVALGQKSGNENLLATPLVDDGFMYMTDAWGVVYKIDVRSGTQRPDRVEDGPRPGEDRPQSRRRAVAQSRHLRHQPRRPRRGDRPGDRQGRLGQEPARPAAI